MRNLLGTEAMKVFAGDFMGSMASGVIPEYTAITADLPGLFAQAVGFPATGETPSDPGTGDTGSSVDLGGNSLTVTVTLTANKAGTGKFYIDIMNGETKVASSSAVTIEFTDPAAEA